MAAREINQASNSVAKLNRRDDVYLSIRNLFIAGRKLNIFHLLLPGFVIQLGAAFLGLADHFSKAVFRFVVGRLLFHDK
jgi:hypothetical protein